jgi:hypothetical protein
LQAAEIRDVESTPIRTSAVSRICRWNFRSIHPRYSRIPCDLADVEHYDTETENVLRDLERRLRELQHEAREMEAKLAEVKRRIVELSGGPDGSDGHDHLSRSPE